jgi:ribonuclease Z
MKPCPVVERRLDRWVSRPSYYTIFLRHALLSWCLWSSVSGFGTGFGTSKSLSRKQHKQQQVLTVNMMLARSSSVSLNDRKKGKGSNKTTLIGRSRAGDGTSFCIPELKWMFDVGALVQGWKPKVVFVSHCHSDHIHYLTRITNEVNPPTIYLPEEAAPFVKAHFIAHQQMTDCMTEAESQNGGKYAVDHILRPTKPGEEIAIRQGGSEFIVRTVAMHHRVPCLGYSVFQKNSRLKDEYIGLPGVEIGKLRKQGVEVTTSFEEPFICFMGDTTAAAFENNPEILRQHKFVVVECSFIDDASLDRAEFTKHMHWESLRPYVEAHPDTMFLLTHFSLKYSILTVRKFFCKLQEQQYDNVHPMIVEQEVNESWKSEGEPPRCKCRLCAEKQS